MRFPASLKAPKGPSLSGLLGPGGRRVDISFFIIVEPTHFAGVFNHAGVHPPLHLGIELFETRRRSAAELSIFSAFQRISLADTFRIWSARICPGKSSRRFCDTSGVRLYPRPNYSSASDHPAKSHGEPQCH